MNQLTYHRNKKGHNMTWLAEKLLSNKTVLCIGMEKPETMLQNLERFGVYAEANPSYSDGQGSSSPLPILEREIIGYSFKLKS